MTREPFSTSGRCCSDLRLDQLLVDELPPDARGALLAHLDASPRCRARYEELRADRDAFMVALPPHALASVDVDNAPVRRVHPRSAWMQFVPLIAAAAAVVVVVRGTGSMADIDTEDLVQTKGAAPRLAVFANERGVARVVDNGRVERGASLRFSVDAPTAGFVGIISVDDVGSISVFAPASDALVAIPRGHTDLPFATALDDRDGREQIRAFVCDADVGTASLRAAVRTGAIPSGCVVDRVTIDVGAGTPR